MSTQPWKRWMFLIAALCMLWGVSRATSVRFEQQKEAFLKIAAAERTKQGLDNLKAAVKYPTPEITLCQLTNVAPGATAEVVLPGKFITGTKFLYENDAITVVSENVTPAKYRATIKAATDALPCITAVHALSPVSGAGAMCHAVHVTGMPDWEFAAANGWTIRLVKGEEKTPPPGGGEPYATYTVQFFRKGESQPFEAFPGRMSLIDACPRGNYTVDLKIEEMSGGEMPPIEEYQKLAQRTADPKITPQEYEKILKRMTELAEKMQTYNENLVKKTTQQNEQGMRLEKFGCKHLDFTAGAGTASGNLRCYDPNTGQPKETKITGTAKAATK